MTNQKGSGKSLISPAKASRIREIRGQMGYPVIDGDGHLLESVPLLLEYVGKEGGPEMARSLAENLREIFTGPGDPSTGAARGPWWPMTADADYQATLTAPSLLADRLEDLGIDFSILYPSLGLALCTFPDPELRQIACRALNRMNADLCARHAARLTPSAVIPMHTPEEAVAELEYVVHELRFKVAMIPPAVARPLEACPEAFPAACRMDRYGIDSDHDYDPVWRAFVDLGLSVSSHGGIGFRYLPAGRCSPTNYAFNHILGHADLQEGLCRSLIFGGVPHRFPELRFLFLEAGVTWATGLLSALEEHWEKRSRGLAIYDPSRLDHERLASLLKAQGLPAVGPENLEREGSQPWVRDEFADAGIREEADIGRFFAEQFFFGCESDDPGVHRAFDARGNPQGVEFRTIFSSDIGHWDVPDLGDVLPQSRGLVEAGLLSEKDYRRFVFELPAQAHLESNPNFFDGTVVEKAVQEQIVKGTLSQ